MELITNKNLYVWENEKLFILNKEKNEFEKIFESKITPLEIECKEFLKCVKSGMPDKDNIIKSQNVIKIIEKSLI